MGKMIREYSSTCTFSEIVPEFIQDLCLCTKIIRSAIQTSYSFPAKTQHFCKHLFDDTPAVCCLLPKQVNMCSRSSPYSINYYVSDMQVLRMQL